MTDKQYFHQIISNIVKNAVDYSPEKSTITISLEEGDRNVAISIADQGPGITADDQKRLFSGYKKMTLAWMNMYC